MRITKFLAATMAAMTIVSCSEQEVFETQTMEPGDAQIVLDLGRSFTTYASEKKESAILNGTAKLYTQDGKTIAWKSGGTIDAAGKLTGVVAADVMSGLADKNVKVMVLANNTGKTIVAGTTETTDYLKEQASTTVADIYTDQALTGGVLSSGEFALELKSGSVATLTTPKLKRTVARIYVKKGGATSIEDYTIKVDKLSDGVKAYTYASSGGVTKTITHTVKKDAIPAPTGDDKWFKDQEPVGYAYPTEVAEVTVTPKGAAGITKQVKLEANKNYSITITPAVGVDGEVTGDFEIDEWGAESDTDIDFNATILSVENAPANFTIVDGALVSDGAVGTPVSNTPAEIKFADLFTGDMATLKIVEIKKATRALDASYEISSDSLFSYDMNDALDGLHMFALQSHGADQKYTITFKGATTGNATERTFVLNVTIKGMNLPKNFVTSVNGVKIMSVGFQTTLEDTKAVVEEINSEAGSTFVDKTKTFALKSDANKEKVLGVRKIAIATCPSGFRAPTMAELKRVFGNGDNFPVYKGKVALTEGDNTFGNATLKYSSSERSLTLSIDGKEHMYLPQVLFRNGNYYFNLQTAEEVGTNEYARLVFWNSELQYESSTSTTTVDSYYRCVQEVETLKH